jgi:hypothetical protein
MAASDRGWQLYEILDRERTASTAVQDGVPKVPQGEPCDAACVILPATRTHECDVLEISRKPKTGKIAATRFLLSRRTSQTPIDLGDTGNPNHQEHAG